MLRCIERLGNGFQADVVEALGVSAPTVSRMLKALVDLGLVAKARFEEWGRVNLVALTMEGEALLKQISDSLLASGVVEIVDETIGSWSHTPRRVSRHIERFYNHLRWVRFVLGDTAIRFGQWCAEENPDDFAETLLRKPLSLFADQKRRKADLPGPPHQIHLGPSIVKRKPNDIQHNRDAA